MLLRYDSPFLACMAILLRLAYGGSFCIQKKKFVKNPYTSTPTSNIIQHVASRSKLECGVKCTEDATCRSYTYTHMQCTLMSDVCGEFVDPTATVACPEDYTLIANKELCIKFVANDVRQANAADDCSTTDPSGHLFSLRSVSDWEAAVMQIPDDAGWVWVAGHGTVGDTWVTWDSQPIPWLRWAYNQPNSADTSIQCLELGRKYSFNMSDASCDGFVRPYICQIDLC